MAKKGLTNEELERLLNESSDSELEDAPEDNLRKENAEDSDESRDSLSDPEWLPEDEEQEFETCLNKIWRKNKNEENDFIFQSKKKIKVTKYDTKVGEVISQGNFQDELLAAQVPASSGTSQKSNNHIIVPNESVLNGKNGYEWKTTSPSIGKTPSRNVVHIRPGIIEPLRNIIDPLHAFRTFFTESMLNKILVHTNEQIEIAQQSYKTQSETVSKTNPEELMALLGLYMS